jgi:hypothetical protein
LDPLDEPWRVSGTYLEACNCEAICPCRAIDGTRGGRSTYGVCAGALSWGIERGNVGRVGLSGLAVGVVFRYRDDEPGSPWTFVLYLDERADSRQQLLLEEVFLGRRAGTALHQFPWARDGSTLVAVRPARIDFDHSAQRGWFRVHRFATLRILGPVETDAAVTCGIPGHDQPGTELVSDELAASDGPLRFEFSGRCGYASRFDYSGPN